MSSILKETLFRAFCLQEDSNKHVQEWPKNQGVHNRQKPQHEKTLQVLAIPKLDWT